MPSLHDRVNGCRWCRRPAKRHGERYTAFVGWHQYTPPTEEQKLKRMLRLGKKVINTDR